MEINDILAGLVALAGLVLAYAAIERGKRWPYGK